MTTVMIILSGVALIGFGGSIFVLGGLLLVEAGRSGAERCFHASEIRSFLESKGAARWLMTVQAVGAGLVSVGCSLVALGAV